jgi:hypothetical protein
MTHRNQDTVDFIQIRKDTGIPSRPWCADIHFKDGKVWMSWQANFRRKGDMVAKIKASTDAEIRD